MRKKLIFLISLTLVFGISANIASGVVDESLVGWWRLDDGSGTTAVDSSGNGNDGALMGDPQWAVGKVGGALQLDGDDDFVDVPHAPILTVDNEVTVMAWINAERHEGPGGEGWQGILAKGNSPRSYSLYTVGASGVLHFSTTSGGAFVGSTSSTQVPLNEWVHVCAQVIDGGHQYYINGEDAGTGGSGINLVGMADTANVVIGRTQEGATRSFLGLIDDARVYNRALTQEEVQIAMIGEGQPFAFGPTPEDGALLEATWTTLTWSAGDFAVSHDVYMSDNLEDVNSGAEAAFQANKPLNDTTLIVGFAGFPFPEGLVPGTTYYWRVDEVNDTDPNSPWTGDVWSFSVPPRKAYNPAPSDGAEFVLTDPELSWTGGFNSKLHTIYFGDDFDTVSNATGGTQQTSTTFVPGPLEPDKTYYWRIDEFDPPATHKGDVWSFTTLPDIQITDPDLMGWWKLDEGQGTTAVDWSGHGRHGTFEGEPVWVQGIDGGALEFDGSSYVDTGYTENLPTYTISCWVKSPDAPSGAAPSGPLHREQNYQFNWNHGNETFRGAAAMNVEDTWQAASYMPLSADTWYHLAATYDGTEFKAYRDGELITTTPVSGEPNPESNSAKLGRHALAEQFFTGTVDDARVYNRALTAEEIQKVMRGDPFVAWDPSPANNSTPNVDDVLPLSWSPGDNAAEHDVYFGTDEDDVDDADATDTTGIYRGRQSSTTFTPAEQIGWGDGPFFWRIDEINTDGTISEGRLWTFTVADFILVDDMESYTDNDADGEAIWQHWIDGFGVNTNGSQVGYTLPPYAEQSIVHSGSQSMPLQYDNTGGVTNSEAEMELTDARDWTEQDVAELSIWFQGRAPSVGSFVEGPGGTITMTGSGADIWGTADQFHFAYRTLTGPGTIIAQVQSVENTDGWAKAGVMIRETLEPGSRHAFGCVTPENGVASQGRLEADGESFNAAEGDITAPHWVRLERDVAGNFTVTHSADGSSWVPVSGAVPQNIQMSSTVHIGLAVTSHNAGVTCEAVFSNVTITGNVTGQWTNQDIGIASNAAEPLYVAVSNAAGTPAIVSNPDPAAANAEEWTPWVIPLSDFSDQGINLSDVDKIAVGLGSRGGAASGGSGIMFIDDIKLYRSGEAPRQ